MGCVYRPRCNQVWSIWYCVCVLLLEAYLLYLGVRRYEAYAEFNWPPGARPQVFLYVYAGLHVAVIALVPFFIAFALFKTGNLASDNEAFGSRVEKTMEIKGSSCCPRRLKSLWMHGPPAAQTVHLMMAFALLMAQQLMIAKLYQEGVLHSEEIWSTELDFIFASGRRLSSVLPMESRGMEQGVRSFRDGSYSALHYAPKILPVLANHKLFGVTLEFLNYVIALLAFAAVYPAVLWKASKWFAFLFSAQLMLHSITAILSYVGFSLLFRLHLTGDRLYPYVPGNLQGAFVLPNEWCVLGSYLIGVVGMYLASGVLYGYGYTRYCLSWQEAAQQRLRSELRAQAGQSGILRRDSDVPNRIGCCEGYCPHLSAILLLVLLVAAKILLLYDTMLIFLSEWPHHLCLTIVIADLTYLFSWILLWLILTCKRRWDFKVSHTVPEILTLLQTDWAPSSAWSKHRRPLTDPDNALLVLAGEELFLTDDLARKQAMLRAAHRQAGGAVSPKEEVYWLRPQNTGSPRVEREAKVPGSPVQREPLSSRILTNRSDNQNYASHLDYGNNAAIYHNYEAQPSKPPRAQQIPPGPAQSQLMLRRDSSGSARVKDVEGNSYMRFDGDGNYDEQQRAQEIANTFGTLPRGGGSGKSRRQLLQGSDADFHYGRVNGSRGGSEVGSVGGAYASIHKSRPSPTPSGLMQTNREMMGMGQAEGAESRGSSYANLPTSSKNGRQQQYAQPRPWEQQNRPPAARVLNVGYPASDRNPSTLSSQQSTPVSSRAYLGQGGNTYAAVGNQDTYGRVRNSPTSSRPTRVPVQPEYATVSATRNGDLYAEYKNGIDNAENSMRLGNQSRELTPMSNASSSTLTRANQGQWQQQGNIPHIDSSEPGSFAFTPSSTLTSQASYHAAPGNTTPTAGSPLDSPHNYPPSQPPPPNARYPKGPAHPHLLAPAHNGIYTDRNDSANFSLTSSNESDPHAAQYATSIV